MATANSNQGSIPQTDADIPPFPSILSELRTIFSSKSPNPPLGWDGVHSFEEKHNIILPEPYRTFIAEIANGCQGEEGPPEWGFVPLTANAIPAAPYADRERRLDKPFPLTKNWNWVNEPGEYKDEEELKGRVAEVWNHGSVLLGDDGCGMYWYLIVSGEMRGHIWLIMMDGEAMPFGRLFGHSEGGVGFYGWVVHWAEGKDWFDDE